MGPKKKGGKKKGGKGKKPKADSGWAKCIQWGKWERPYESLPDAVKWPAFAPIRENMLEALQWLEIIWSKTMDESFIDLELFYVPRPNLARLDIRGTYSIKKFTLSPYDKLPALTYLDISCMAVLENVLIQCNSLEWVTLARSFELKKALLETRNLKELIIDTCPKLGTLIIWSEELTSIKGLTDSKILTKLELFCPKLVDFERPPLYVSACMSSFINKVHYTQSLQLRFCYHIAPGRNTEGS
ncbi:hypothetical protein CY35_17G070000 [Sphagnum magellanicum]|nr:hypothetical protein CY35_17G070000 [Sphagnum magellanicum]